MLDRPLAFFAVVCLALSTGGCGAAADPALAPGSGTGAASNAASAGQAPGGAGAAGTAPIDVADADVALLKRSRVGARLADGRVLSAGADEDAPGPAAAAQVFDPRTRRWTEVGSLGTPRIHHAIAALADGRALVCGGEEVSKTGSPIAAAGAPLDTCELFDAAAGRFSAAPKMHAARRRFTMTRLADGRVLAVGDPASEIFDPKKATWSGAIPTAVPYLGHTATLLQDGRVLVVGVGGSPFRAGAEVFDPAADKWSAEPPPPQAVLDHTATMLQDGSVLIAGGQAALGGIPRPITFAAVFEPKHERWNVTGQPHATHWRHGALLLPNGDVVVAGGGGSDPELYSHESWKDLSPALVERLDLARKAPAPTATPH